MKNPRCGYGAHCCGPDREPITLRVGALVPAVHSLRRLTFGPNLIDGRRLIAARQAQPFQPLFACHRRSDDLCLNVAQVSIVSHRSPWNISRTDKVMLQAS
jgi:hypothetical protein